MALHQALEEARHQRDTHRDDRVHQHQAQDIPPQERQQSDSLQPQVQASQLVDQELAPPPPGTKMQVMSH